MPSPLDRAARNVVRGGAPAAAPSEWLATLRAYLQLALALNVAWEIAQLPLYTIWRDGSARQIAFAVAHCTLGDLFIASLSLVLALVALGSAEWPARRFVSVAAGATVTGAAYTVWSEWLNVSVRGAWAYAPAMPVVPPLGTGLTPLLQWLLIPPLALGLAHRAAAIG